MVNKSMLAYLKYLFCRILTGNVRPADESVTALFAWRPLLVNFTTWQRYVFSI